MKAMIFAAGLGTRLKPLTDSVPKALIPVAGKPLLQHIIGKLIQSGFDEIIVNVHHFPDMIIQFLKDNHNFGVRIEVSDERDLLLDTGGGIRKAAHFFDDGKPFLVHNVDILSNLNLNELYNHHIRHNALATLTVSRRDTFRYLLFDNNMQLKGWINEKTGDTKPKGFSYSGEYNKLAFSGIQILSPDIFEMMAGYEAKFPIMDFYLENACNQAISGFIPDNYRMIDVGKLDVLDEAEKFVNL